MMSHLNPRLCLCTYLILVLFVLEVVFFFLIKLQFDLITLKYFYYAMHHMATQRPGSVLRECMTF